MSQSAVSCPSPANEFGWLSKTRLKPKPKSDKHKEWKKKKKGDSQNTHSCLLRKPCVLLWHEHELPTSLGKVISGSGHGGANELFRQLVSESREHSDIQTSAPKPEPEVARPNSMSFFVLHKTSPGAREFGPRSNIPVSIGLSICLGNRSRKSGPKEIQST
jgi:hypothetical protein